MTAAIPERVQGELIAGDTWVFTRELSDYPASLWTATIYFENQDSVFSVVGTASGTTHSFSIAAATSASYAAGRYGWRLRVADIATGLQVTTVENGITEVLVNPAAAGRTDTRSFARRTLEAVEAFLEGNASTAQKAMSIQGRSIERWSLSELTKWRDQLRSEVIAEDQGENAGLGRNIKVRYGRP